MVEIKVIKDFSRKKELIVILAKISTKFKHKKLNKRRKKEFHSYKLKPNNILDNMYLLKNKFNNTKA